MLNCIVSEWIQSGHCCSENNFCSLHPTIFLLSVKVSQRYLNTFLLLEVRKLQIDVFTKLSKKNPVGIRLDTWHAELG